MHATMFCANSGSLREPSSAAGRPNIAGSGCRLVDPDWMQRPAMLHQHDELRHASAKAGAQVRRVDVARRGERGRAVGQQCKERRLVGDQGAHLLWMAFHEGQRIHCSTAAGEQVHRAASPAPAEADADPPRAARGSRDWQDRFSDFARCHAGRRSRRRGP